MADRSEARHGGVPTFAPEAELAWKSHHYFRNWSDIVGGRRRLPLSRPGSRWWLTSATRTRLRANVAMLRGVGVDTEVVTAAELHRREPHASVDDVALAAFEPHSGYADPVATTESLAAAAKRYGAEFSIDTPVARIASRGGRAIGVVDAVGRVHEATRYALWPAPGLTHCSHRWSAKIGIRSERAQIAFFKRPSQIKHCIYIDTIAGSYFRPHGDDLTLSGWAVNERVIRPEHRLATRDTRSRASSRTCTARSTRAHRSSPRACRTAGCADVGHRLAHPRSPALR